MRIFTSDDDDPLLKEAAKVLLQYDRASASLIQRRLSIGYARSTRILDQLEHYGIVGPAEGARAREVLIDSLAGLEKTKLAPVTVIFPTIDYKQLKPACIKINKKPGWSPQLTEYLHSKQYSPQKILIGKTTDDKSVFETLESFPNLLIAGNPNSRKEVFLDSFLIQSLLAYDHNYLKFIFIDETNYLNLYHNLPHLLTPITADIYKSIAALKWLISELERRNKLFTEVNVRNFNDYNQTHPKEPLPYIFTIYITFQIDFPDFRMCLEKLLNLGKKHGIGTILVLNQTSYKQISTDLKSACPARLIFQTTSATDSSTSGVKNAHKLLPGQAIYKTGPNSAENALTIPYVSDKNVTEIMTKIKKLFKLSKNL